MNINIRRAIALTFIIAFLVTAPLLIFYTAGYRYNFKKAQVQKTGTLIVKTTPRSALVSLNGKSFEATTPLRENNILPDEYDIEITKSGYYPWQKRLSIRPQETTFIEDVVLFPQSQAEKITDYSISHLSFSPRGNYALFVTEDLNQTFLYLLNLNNFRSKLIINDDRPWEKIKIDWAADDSKALIDIDNMLLVVTTIFPQQKIKLANYFPEISDSDTKLKWDDKDSNLLYWQNKNIVYELNLISLINSQVYNGQNQIINDFLIRNDEVYLLEKINDKIFMTKQSRTNNKKLAAIELRELDYQFNGFIQGYISLISQDYKTVFLVNNTLDKIVFNKENIQSTELSEVNNFLSLITPQEASFLDLDDNELREQNITRYSNGLMKSQWSRASSNYIFTLQNGKISVLELDSRDKRFSLEFPVSQVKDFTINANDEALIFWQEDYLYQLPISK